MVGKFWKRVYRYVLFALVVLLAIPLVAFQADDGVLWVYVHQIALILATLAGGGGTVWAVNRLKAFLNLSGTPALLLTALVSGLVALATLVVDGVIVPGAVGPDSFGFLFLLVFAEAKVIYDMVTERG